MHVCFIFHIGVNKHTESTKLCSVCNLIRVQVMAEKNQVKVKYVVQYKRWRGRRLQFKLSICSKKKNLFGGIQKYRVNAAINL